MKIPQSSEPIVRVQGMKEEAMDSDSDDGSDDSGLYYEFDSDQEPPNENASSTTKSTFTMPNNNSRKVPMIIDITPPTMQN